MLIGAKPYDGETAMSVIVKHRHAPVPVLPPATAEFQPLIERMLAKKPSARFQNVAELLAWEPAL